MTNAQKLAELAAKCADELESSITREYSMLKQIQHGLSEQDVRMRRIRHEDCHKLREALRAYQWRPIETAPTDGTLVLLHNALGNTHAARYGGCHLGDDVIGWTAEGKWVAKPTHWMPLPQSPTAAPEAQDNV